LHVLLFINGIHSLPGNLLRCVDSLHHWYTHL